MPKNRRIKLTESEIKLVSWVKGRAGSFTNDLFELISKADVNNMAKLATAFPDECECFRKYRNCDGYYQKLEQIWDGK